MLGQADMRSTPQKPWVWRKRIIQSFMLLSTFHDDREPLISSNSSSTCPAMRAVYGGGQGLDRQGGCVRS